jgi:hypothetical protein
LISACIHATNLTSFASQERDAFLDQLLSSMDLIIPETNGLWKIIMHDL